jgi:hypothetical protein
MCSMIRGSRTKVAVFERRAAAGLALFNPQDQAPDAR